MLVVLLVVVHASSSTSTSSCASSSASSRRFAGFKLPSQTGNILCILCSFCADFLSSMKQRFRYINAQDAQDRLQNWRV